ncbi:MAG TPA: type II and III secretion system protein family protein [Xanthobacteraceae bacterium]
MSVTRPHFPQRRRARHRALALACLAATTAGAPALGLAAEASVREVQVGEAETALHVVTLGIGKSLVVELPRDAKDVLVANPQIANAVVRTAQRAYIIGTGIGQTNVFFFDAEGRQIAGFDIAVTRDLNGLRTALKQILPQSVIRAEGIGPSGVVLIGEVGSPVEAQQAVALAGRLVGDVNNVVNNLTIKAREQVMLKVTVAEVQRDVIKQLGINFNGSLGYGNAVVGFNTAHPFSANGQAVGDNSLGAGWISGNNRITATLSAMERAGVIRTLAEPNLTAISGENANFVVGGEFPVPGGYSCDPTTRPPTCQIQVQFKKFGVGLNFTPVVLGEGRISLKVMTEVSELSSENSIVVQPTAEARPITIPSIRTRRAETIVEIPSGGSLAMAGMIHEQTKQAINGVPGLMQVPILGTLFKSRDYVNRQTELMVLVTPYIVRAVAAKELSRPDDGFADPSDAGAILLGKLNKIYAPPGKGDPRRPYHGPYGFILD